MSRHSGWVTYLSGVRPKLPLEILSATSTTDSLPDIGQEIPPNGSFLISSAAGPDPEWSVVLVTTKRLVSAEADL